MTGGISFLIVFILYPTNLDVLVIFENYGFISNELPFFLDDL